MMTPFVFANLPVELVRDIFEHAARDDLATARDLTLVSSAVRRWTDPLLYHTVILASARALKAFAAALALKPASFAAAHVRTLGVLTVGPAPTVARILGACTGATNVACACALPTPAPAPPSLPPQILPGPRERHLLGPALRDAAGWDAALAPAAARASTTTHLRLHLPSFDAARPDSPFSFGAGAGADAAPGAGWARLRALPALTHLALVYRPSGEAPAGTIVPHLARLLAPASTADADALPLARLQLVLVQIVGAKKDAGFAAAAVDALNAAAIAQGGAALRVVAEHAPMSAARQWADAVRAGRGVWEEAEAVVRARTRAKSSACTGSRSV
ncbi:uncharacterized protein BXZ73DRAFT_47948 [Epithele typhae]|uniref:uncharacterized protein n=1 Tax=Epithele typhae TaxID=378194 RepID=UPI0020079847|nr:uncharacterized protein BXZ73DRAFT_47948 [Epithele typhae]KAH9929512.1 hypothetical protein BXZ73DRAFT_47948 [Epithele typhae]